eukprot:scaffold100695_cov32-Tisochrysis_lutea.AAC.6
MDGQSPETPLAIGARELRDYSGRRGRKWVRAASSTFFEGRIVNMRCWLGSTMSDDVDERR